MHQAKLLVDRRIGGINPDGNPCHMLLPISCFNNDRTVEIIQCSFLNDGAGHSMIKIYDPTRELDKYCGPTHTLDLMGEYSIIKTGNCQYLATIMNVNCRLAKIGSESGCFITSAVPLNDHVIKWVVLAPNKMLVKALVKRMLDEGYGVQIISSVEINLDYTLTPKQEEVLRYAFENGYYDIPKKLTTEGLCEKFDCSKSTMSVIIRDAEKNVIKYFLDLGHGRIKKE